jgi:hypothetical protein
MDGGFYQNRVVTPGKSGVTAIDSYTRLPDSTNFTNTYNQSQQFTIDNIGLYFDPTYKICEGIYGAFNLEFRRRSVTTTTTYSLQNTDSVVKSKGIVSQTNKSPQFATGTTTDTTFDNLLFGPGILAEYKDHNISFYFYSALVFNPPLSSSRNIIDYKKASWLIQFKLTESNSNISIGGEVRNYNMERNGIRNEYLLYLARELPITFLGSVLGALFK